MEVRCLEPTTAVAPIMRADAAFAVAGMIGNIGDRSFGQCAIEQLNRLLPLDWWTVYRMFDDAPPRLHAGGHLHADDCVADSFGAYRGGLYRRDRIFALAREQVADGAAVMTYLRATEMQPEHRQRIYTRHGLSERLSLLACDEGGGMLSVNLYRHVDQPFISDDERELFLQIGPVLLACVSRHLALAPAGGVDNVLGALPRREREVCQRLLRGWTHDGIAADLKLAPTTVKTYRDRAFERLGIHHRNELFALVMSEAGVPI
ncbi:MAG: helix-turn-helix transcriptional regulator [Burkholderiaceae bacterium]